MAKDKRCTSQEGGLSDRGPALHQNSQTETKTKGPSGFFMPLDIITNIVSRLPIKSIARLRCVCKLWCFLTYDAHFLISQHKRPSSLRFLSRCVYNYIIFYDFDTKDGKKIDEDCSRFHHDSSRYKLSNSVHGLTCASSPMGNVKSDICILNPTTHESLRLPKPHEFKQQEQPYLDSEMFSLGFDDSTGEYKVVRLYSGNNWKASCYCDIFTVGTAQWRCIGETPYKFVNDSAVFLNGSLHWIGKGPKSDAIGYCIVILTFDMKEEKFGSAISIPQSLQSKPIAKSLRKSGGQLCMMVNNKPGEQFEIWILEDYVSGTWVKRHCLSCNILPSLGLDSTFIGIVDDCVLIESYQGEGKWSINCYDPHNKILYKLFDGAREGVFSHQESLISPKRLVGNIKFCSQKSSSARRIVRATKLQTTIKLSRHKFLHFGAVFITGIVF